MQTDNHFDWLDPTRFCPKCGHTAHNVDATTCEICCSELKKRTRGEKSAKYPINSPINRVFNQKNHKLVDYWLSCLPKIGNHGQLGVNSKSLKKPINLIGLVVIGLMLFQGLNHGKLLSQNRASAYDQLVNEKVKVVNSSPKGLFSYGGASFFASLVSSGLNASVEAAYPDFELRYTKPVNQDFSNSNGIKMLIDGELTFAFNGRALTDAEYHKASLRGIQLKQIPIALDGVVFFGNNKIPTSNLNTQQVKAIFEGKITNWNSIDSDLQDLPIVPVLLNNENLTMLGLEASEVASTTQYSPNYTQALRKVIATPGAISFASASLVQDQQLVEIFKLADGNSYNYIEPLIDMSPNLDAYSKGTYPLTRRLFLVYREDGTSEEQAGLAYANFLIAESGQKIVKKAGFVPLYLE